MFTPTWGANAGAQLQVRWRPSHGADDAQDQVAFGRADAGAETISLGAGEHGLRFRRPDGSQVIALWAEQRATWSLRAEGPGDARVLGRDGADLTPAGLSDGAQVTLELDDGPIYLVGDIAVTSVE